MQTIDRQIVAALDQLHHTYVGKHPDGCRWDYNEPCLTYMCSHMVVQAKEVVEKVQSRNYFVNGGV